MSRHNHADCPYCDFEIDIIDFNLSKNCEGCGKELDWDWYDDKYTGYPIFFAEKKLKEKE